MKKLFTTLCLLIGLLLQSFAQNSEYVDRMDYIFQNLNRSQVSTGLLLDYGVSLVDVEVFNGVLKDSNFVNMDTWKMLYSGLFSSKFGTNANLTSPETVFDAVSNASEQAVSMMYFNYQQLNPDAINLGYVNVANDQIIPLVSQAQIYQQRTLFAIAPKQLQFSGPTVSFLFSPSLYFTNSAKTIQQIEVNFNNESGFMPVSWNTPVLFDFPESGTKEILFRIRFTDGTSFTSHTNIFVERGTNSPSNASGVRAWNDTLIIDGTSQHSGGKIEISYSSANKATKTIKKPLIVAEGFDVSSIMGEDYNADIGDFIKYSGITDTTHIGTIGVDYSEGNLLSHLDLAGYDIIYLDYNNGVDDIWRNAQLFKEVIKWVNNNKQGTEQNVVMGLSMGGLVARIALKQLENENYHHQTKKYISVDAPHKGANVPVGIQAAVRHIASLNLVISLFPFIPAFDAERDIEMVKKAVTLLNCSAAKQMLIYTINEVYHFDNSVHDAFQQQYDQLGLPKWCENIAISNGSNSGDLNFASGSAFVDFNFTLSFKGWLDVLSAFSPLFLVTNYPQIYLNKIPGHSEVKAEIKVNALQNQRVSEIYKGELYIRKKILWFIPVNISIESKTVNSTAAMLPLDGAPGGRYSLDAMGVDIPSGFSRAIKQTDFSFVPTVSALALDNWQSQLTRPLTYVSDSPFKSLFTQGNNELHTRLNSSAKFLKDQLIGTISRDPFVGTSSNFTFSNGNATSWQVTPSNLFVITDSNAASATVKALKPTGESGVLTAHIHGFAVHHNIHATDIKPFIEGPDEISLSVDAVGSYYIQGLLRGAVVTWEKSSNNILFDEPANRQVLYSEDPDDNDDDSDSTEEDTTATDDSAPTDETDPTTDETDPTTGETDPTIDETDPTTDDSTATEDDTTDDTSTTDDTTTTEDPNTTDDTSTTDDTTTTEDPNTTDDTSATDDSAAPTDDPNTTDDGTSTTDDPTTTDNSTYSIPTSGNGTYIVDKNYYKQVYVNPNLPKPYCSNEWIKVIITLPEYNDFQIIIKKDIKVGRALNDSLIGSFYVNAGIFPQEDVSNWTADEFYPYHFIDTLYYNWNPIRYSNPFGITDIQWSTDLYADEINEMPYEPEPSVTDSPDDIIAQSIKSLGVQKFNSNDQARVQARVRNQCVWSNWKTLILHGPPVLVEDMPIVPDPEIPEDPFPGDDTEGSTIGGGGDEEPVTDEVAFRIAYSPNPTTDELTVEFEKLPTTDGQPETYSVSLLDKLGATKRSTKFKHKHKKDKAKPVKFNISSLRPGTYFLHVEGKGKIHKEQIVKE